MQIPVLVSLSQLSRENEAKDAQLKTMADELRRLKDKLARQESLEDEVKKILCQTEQFCFVLHCVQIHFLKVYEVCPFLNIYKSLTPNTYIFQDFLWVFVNLFKR